MQKKFFEQIKKVILSSLSFKQKEEKLTNYHSRDISIVLQTLTSKERVETYKALGLDVTAEIFSFYDNVKDYMEEVDYDFAADILESMDSDEALRIIDELDEEYKTEILNQMDYAFKEKVTKLDAYDDDYVGSYMSDNYITVLNSDTIKTAMSKLVLEAGQHDNISILYVTDNDNHLIGTIQLKDLILARADQSLESLCMTSCPTLYDTEAISDCIDRLTDYAEDTVAVIDKENILLGVISVSSLVHLVDEEMKDDYAKLAGLSESEDENESTFSSIKKRVPWLIILLFLGVIVSSVIGAFEVVIAALPVVVFFQSMVLDMAGNVGTQSLAVTIRSISNDEIRRKKLWSIVFKELKLGFFNGLIIGVIGFVFIFLYLFVRKQEIVSGMGFQVLDTLKVSSITSFSLFLAMIFSSFIGTIFPIFLDKIHIDPAVASGPFITTLNDVIAVVVYYGLIYIFFIFLL